MKKNNFKSLAAVLSLAMAATAIPASADAAAAPKLTVKSTTVYSGETYNMTVKNLKKGYTVNFSSTNGGVKFAKKKIKAKGAKISSKFTVMAAKNIADGSATKIKAVVRNAKGKKIKSVTKKVTLKQLASSITLKDIATKTVTVGTIVNADATIAPKAAKGAYAKTFTSSDSSVLKVTNASNGLFEAVAPGTATISVSAANGDQVVEGGTIQITVVEAEEQDQNPGATAPGTDQGTTNPQPGDTTGSAILTDYRLTLSANKTSITADSKDQAVIDIILEAPTDTEATSAMLASAQLELGTTGIGSLSQNDVTLTYNEANKRWEGQVIFTSATLKNAVTSTIKATISRVLNGPEGEQIIGVNSNELAIYLTPENVTVDESTAVSVKQAVVESCDRIVVTFAQPVSAESFLTYKGLVADGTVEDVKDGVTIKKAHYFDLYVWDKANEKDSAADLQASYSTFKAKKTDDVEAEARSESRFYTTHIRDIQQTSSDTLTFILKNGYELSDNSRFVLYFVDKHTNKEVASDTSGRITDTTVPTILKVEENSDKKSIKITFDQPVVSYGDVPKGGTPDGYDSDMINPDSWDSTIHGMENNTVAMDKWSKSAFNPKNYTINGTNLGELAEGKEVYTWEGDEYRSLYGAGVKIYLAKDENGKVNLNRNEIIIELGYTLSAKWNGINVVNYDQDRGKGRQVYFKPGQYTLTVNNIGDYASLSDNANKMVSKGLDFTITENTDVPDIRVEAQSPEQYIITFTTPIEELEGVKVGEELGGDWIGSKDNNTKGRIFLRYKDPKAKWYNTAVKADRVSNLNNGGWVDATRPFNYLTWDRERGLDQAFKLTRIEDTAEGLPRLKMEVTRDWTMLRDYSWDDKLYYNYTLGIGLNWGTVTNLVNGLKNAGDDRRYDVVASANEGGVTKVLGGVVTSYDGTSPEIKEVQLIQDTHNSIFDVVFSEPVQGANDSFSKYGHMITPSWNKVLGTLNGEGGKDSAKAGAHTTPEDMADIIVRIYDKDTKKIWNAEVQGYSSLTDETIRVQTTTLPAGNYTMYVTGASDDVGNTAKTLSYDFTIGDDSGAADFKVLSVIADMNVADGNITSLQNSVKDGNQDALYVEFSSFYAQAPLSASVLNPSNWTVNGVTLPVGTRIANGININGKSYPNGITIYLEDGTITGLNSTSVKLNANVVNADGVGLTGMTTFNTQAIFQRSRFAKVADRVEDDYGTDITISGINDNDRATENLSINN